MTRAGVVPENVPHIESFSRANVVSHSTYESHLPPQRQRVFGRRRRTRVPTTRALAKLSQIKAGVSACHFRINGCATGRNDGKLLVFQSGNTIRAGKHSHEDALRSLFRFNQFVRRASGVPHEWHAAIDHPNMVLSGKLAKLPSEKFKRHWRCNHTQKFPGVAVKTGSTTTPEVYPKSGTFIMPGTRDVASLKSGLKAMADALEEPQLHGGGQETPGGGGREGGGEGGRGGI